MLDHRPTGNEYGWVGRSEHIGPEVGGTILEVRFDLSRRIPNLILPTPGMLLAP